MPRIRRWHPVSHDLIRDREFLALLEIHPRLGYVWLEMLSEADRNEGRVKGTREEIEHGLARIVNPLHPYKGRHWTRLGLAYMESRGWVEQRQRVRRGSLWEEHSHFYVRNYPEYHPRREQASSPPVLPALPALDKQKDKDPSPELAPNIRAWLDRSQHLQCLSNGKHGAYWKALEVAYDGYEWLYFEEEIKKADAWMAANPKRKPTERGMPRFFRSWLERAVERGRKTHG